MKTLKFALGLIFAIIIIFISIFILYLFFKAVEYCYINKINGYYVFGTLLLIWLISYSIYKKESTIELGEYIINKFKKN